MEIVVNAARKNTSSKVGGGTLVSLNIIDIVSSVNRHMVIMKQPPSTMIAWFVMALAGRLVSRHSYEVANRYHDKEHACQIRNTVLHAGRHYAILR